MTPPTNDIAWFGAGWFAGTPPALAVIILVAVLAAGMAIVVVSYRFTLIQLSPRRRAVLCLVRLSTFAALLLLLAAPAHVERTFDHAAPSRPLAVLVDRSDSMTAPDNRGRRRIDDALQQWNRLEAPARKAFSSIETLAFAEGMMPIAQATDAAVLPGGRTDLFASLQDALAHAPAAGWGAMVALTDGLDTSGVNPDDAQRATTLRAIAAGTPLYFVVGHNRAIEAPFLRLRTWNAPPRTNLRSVFRVEANFESFQTEPVTVPVDFVVNGRARPSQPLRLQIGRHAETWTADVPADNPGTLELELHAGTETARAEVQIERPVPRRVLYDAGAVDWGYRFVAEILKRGDAFSVTSVFNLPNVGIDLPPGAVSNVPLTADGLEPYDAVVLANLKPGQLSAAEQTALSQWVGQGGILFAIVSGADAVRALAGTEIEKVLPVVLAPAAQPASTPALISDLTPFHWDDMPVVNEIFRPTADADLGDMTPRFSTFIPIERAKPGAEVLARHPTEKGPDGSGAILLAVQRYGQGRSAVLATDPLWRWKLGESSQSRGAELFWQQLFSWLVRDRNPGLFFDQPPVNALTASELVFRVGGTGTAPVRVEARLGGHRDELPEQGTADAFHEYRWRPGSAGMWEIRAETTKGESARSWVLVRQPAKPGELSGTAPNEELLRALAAETGGAVLEEVPAAWREMASPPKLIRERRQPLWHRGSVFALLLGLYGLELVLRRRWKLL